MRQAMITLGCICLAAAVCEQMLDGSRYFPAVRLALGLELASLALSAGLELVKMLNG